MALLAARHVETAVASEERAAVGRGRLRGSRLGLRDRTLVLSAQRTAVTRRSRGFAESSPARSSRRWRIAHVGHASGAIGVASCRTETSPARTSRTTSARVIVSTSSRRSASTTRPAACSSSRRWRRGSG